MNQLVSSICWLAIVFNVIVRTQIICIYILGPLPVFLCSIYITLHGGFAIQLLLLLSSIIVVRYIFTIHFKNPTATQHDFWKFFLSIWSFGLGMTSQTAYVLLPGKNPSQYYVCIGKIPTSLNKELTKFNVVVFCSVTFTVCAHVFLGIRLKLYEFKISKVALNNAALKLQKNKNSLLTASFHLLIVTSYFATLVPAFKSILMNLEHLNEYPNYLWMYLFHFYTTECFIIISLICLITKNPQMKAFIKREILEICMWILKS